jgi:Rrf2 family protein
MVTNRGDRLRLAIRALVMLAEAPRGMATSAEIGEALDAHPVVLRRLLGVLKWEGIVESRAGQHGGWALALDPSRITLGRVSRALAEEAEVVTPASLDAVLERARQASLDELDRVTLASLLD